MARRYWLKVDGKRVYNGALATLAEAKRMGQAAADAFGQVVQIGYDDAAPKKRRMKRNPVLQDYDFTGEEWKITARGPNGRTVAAYCGSEAEAKDESRVLARNGYRVTHILRLKGPNEPAPTPRRRR